MKRKVIRLMLTLVIVTLHADMVFAQQNAMFSQYMFNTLAINPAYAGSRNVVAATALYRNQWVGMEGAPQTGTFTVDAPFAGERIGLGMQIVNDKIGITSTSTAAISAAYRIPLNYGSISFGMQGSVSKYRAGFSSVELDPAGPVYDPAYGLDVNSVLYNFGSGIYYNTERFYAGLSVQDFVRNRLNDSIGNDDEIVARQSSHAYLASGYVFPLGYDFNLKTAVLFKGVRGAPLQADINATLWIKNIVAIGAEYRTSADVSALVELRVTPQVRLGYAHDRSVTSLRSFNSGSHEFMLRYEFSFDRDKMLSPRYF